MEKTFYINSPFTTKTSKEKAKKLRIEGYANTTTKDRSGDIITADAWRKGIDNYRNNPILLNQHKHDQPIGRVDTISVDDKGIFVEASISDAAEKLYGIKTLIQDKALKSFSVGFRIKDGMRNDDNEDSLTITDVELLEISVVSVPCNQESLFSVKKSFDADNSYKAFIDSITSKNNSIVDNDESISEENNNIDTNDLQNGDIVNFKNKMFKVVKIATDQSPIFKFLEIDENGKECNNILNVDKEEISQLSEKKISESNQTEILHDDSNSKENTNMAEQVVESIDLTKAVKTDEVPAKQPASINQVNAPVVEQLVKETGEKLLAVADNEDLRGDYNSAEKEELKELLIQMNKAKDEIKALEHTKMEFQENSRNSSQFSKGDMTKAVFLSKLLDKRDVFDTLLSTFSTEVHKEMEQSLVIAPMFTRMSVNSKSFSFPVSDEDTDGDVAMFKSGTYATGIADTTNVPTSNQGAISAVDLTPHKFMASTHLPKDEQEDNVIPLIDYLREQATRRLARAIDKSILRGTGTLTGFNASPTNAITAGTGYSSVITGITKLAAAASLETSTGAATGKADPSNIAAARVLLGKYGLQVGSDLVYVTSVEGYNNLITTADFRTVDKFGPDATYKTGTVGAVYGIPVVVSEFMDNVGATGNHLGSLIYKPGFMIGERRAIEVESEYEPRQQVTAIYMSTRFDFKAKTTVANAGLSSRYSLAATVVAG